MDKLSDDEVSNCPECDGQGSYDQWKAVAGHYEGGEVFRLQCDHCDGTGKCLPGIKPHIRRNATWGWECWARGYGGWTGHGLTPHEAWVNWAQVVVMWPVGRLESA